MQKCSYCGRENDEKARHCRECGTEFEQNLEAPELTRPSAAHINLDEVDDAFIVENGFSRPRWPVILKVLRPFRVSDEKRAAWLDVMSQWASHWETELGNDFWLTRSGSFLLLSELDGERAEQILQKANRLAENIRAGLASLAWEERPYLLLIHIADETLHGRFGEAAFYGDQETSVETDALYVETEISNRTPCSILLCGWDETVMNRELEGGIVWSALSHLPLPQWLYRGVGAHLFYSADLQRGSQAPVFFDLDLIPEHRRFWNEVTIQSFWAGTCATEYPETANLCDELNKVLVHLISEKSRSLVDFLRCAHYRDAGQSAAQSCLKTDLGELAGTFLGPGHWSPDTLAIAECWDRRPSESSSDDE